MTITCYFTIAKLVLTIFLNFSKYNKVVKHGLLEQIDGLYTMATYVSEAALLNLDDLNGLWILKQRYWH